MGKAEIHVFGVAEAVPPPFTPAEVLAAEIEREKALKLPPHIMKWLYAGHTRIEPDGVRRPRKTARQRQSFFSTSLVSLFNAQGGMCCYCGHEMTLPNKTRSKRSPWATDAEVTAVGEGTSRPLTEVTRDHLKAKSDGGPGLLENFAAACRLCNQEKGDLPLVIFLLARTTNTVREQHRKLKKVKLALRQTQPPVKIP